MSIRLFNQPRCQQERAVRLAVRQTWDAILPFTDCDGVCNGTWFGPVFAANSIRGMIPSEFVCE